MVFLNVFDIFQNEAARKNMFNNHWAAVLLFIGFMWISV